MTTECIVAIKMLGATQHIANHQWELVKTVTNYSCPELGTGSWTEYYECANCDECRTMNIVSNRSGD